MTPSKLNVGKSRTKIPRLIDLMPRGPVAAAFARHIEQPCPNTAAGIEMSRATLKAVQSRRRKAEGGRRNVRELRKAECGRRNISSLNLLSRTLIIILRFHNGLYHWLAGISTFQSPNAMTAKQTDIHPFPHSSFLIPHFAFCILHSAFRILHSAFPIPHSNFTDTEGDKDAPRRGRA
jgi:hypothetical protein